LSYQEGLEDSLELCLVEVLKNRQRLYEARNVNKTLGKHLRDRMQRSLRPHDVTLILKMLRTLANSSKNTMAIYRELKRDAGFRNHHSFYRQLNFCLKHRLIELADVNKKWGIPTKIYRLTEKGKSLLSLFENKMRL